MNDKTSPALDVKRMHFSFTCPEDWNRDVLALGCRLRGSLGLTLKTSCCFFDPKQTSCEGCHKRPHCHYGQSFESPQAVQVSGFGTMPSLPHAWALTVDLVGVRVAATLILAGMELAHEASWKASIEALNIAIQWHNETWFKADFSFDWQGLTPMRLRLNGKNPGADAELCTAVHHSIVSKTRMLAALHGTTIPTALLPEPACTQAQWCKASRYAFRTQKKQSMSGWLCHITWPDDTPKAWLPWLQLSYVLGVGKQTSFGLGRFS